MIDLSKVEEKFKEEKGYWFDYPDDNDVKIKIKPLFPDKANELAKKSITLNQRGIKEIDEDKLSELTRNYIIEDWKGISINGNNECTNEAKLLLAKYCDDIVKFILRKSKELATIISLQDEEQLKNLKNLLGQS